MALFNYETAPQQHDLIALFESAPIITDPDAPWAYNQLTFTRTMGENRIDCEIEPGYRMLKLRWFQRGVLVVNLDLNVVSGLAVELEPGRETFIAQFRARQNLLPLRFQISPTVQIWWCRQHFLD